MVRKQYLRGKYSNSKSTSKVGHGKRRKSDLALLFVASIAESMALNE